MSRRDAKDKVVRGLEFCAEVIGLVLLVLPFLRKSKVAPRKKPRR